MGDGSFFSGGQRGWGVKLTTQLYLVSRSKMIELYLHSPICSHGLVFNYLHAGSTLSEILVAVVVVAAGAGEERFLQWAHWSVLTPLSLSCHVNSDGAITYLRKL